MFRLQVFTRALFVVAAAAPSFLIIHHATPTLASRRINDEMNSGRNLQSECSLEIEEFQAELQSRIVGGIEVDPPQKYPYVVSLVRFGVSCFGMRMLTT